MLEIKKRNLLINVFNDISDLHDFINNTPRRIGAQNESRENRNSFCGGISYDEAIDIMRYGDENLFKKILDKKKKADISKILGQSIKKRRQNNDIVGFTANVPAYLSGNPMSMINRNNPHETHKILNICLNADVSAFVSSDDVQRSGVVYINVIDILEKMNYRCNLYVTYSVNTRGGERIYFLTRIKTDREPLNIKKMAFPIAHVGMFRRIGFKWIESCNCNSEPTHNGYGSPISDWEETKRVLDKELKNNFVVLNYQDSKDVSIEGAIKCLKEQGLKLDIDL